jgi:uncharacterized protein (DUF58 family)
MILPTRKFLLILLLPAGVMLVWRGSVGLALGLALDLAALFLAGFDWLISPRPQKLHVERFLPPFLSLGADNPVGWDVRNAARYPITFELTEDVPDSIVRDRRRIAAELRPHAHAELRYQARPTVRGLHEFGAIHVRCVTLLGLLARQVRIDARSSVKVYPNVVSLRRYELALQRHRTAELGLKSVRERGRGYLFESLREYVVGDDWADIAWKATARRGRLITRHYEAERNQNVLVMLDCGRLMTTEVDGVARLDYAINATLLLTYVAMKQGDAIGLLAFSDQIAGYVPPLRGKGALGRMNEVLYRLEPSLTESNYDRACRFLALRYRKRSLIIIFTDVIDKDASATLLAHVGRFARQHLPLCLTMRNLEVERLALALPRRPDDCFTKTVALQSLERRGEALARMRRSGVDVLDTDPRALTPTVVSRYLWLKQHRRL